MNRRSATLPLAWRYKYKVDAALANALRARHAVGESDSAIARSVGLSRRTIYYWTRGEGSLYAPLAWVSRAPACAPACAQPA